MVPTFWLQERLKASLSEKFLPLLASSLFDGEMELDVRSPNNAHKHHQRNATQRNTTQHNTLLKRCVVRQPARATDAAVIPQNQERLQRACDGMVAMIQSLQFPLCAPPLARSLLFSCTHHLSREN